MEIGVKICGLRRQEDAERAAEYGAFALGFVFEPSSPRYVGDIEWDPPWRGRIEGCHVAVFGIPPTSGVPSSFDAIQAVEWPDATPASTKAILIKVHRLANSVQLAGSIPQVSPFSWFLIDAFDPHSYGGSGKTVDFALAAELVRELRRSAAEPGAKIGLAGGLTPDNVAKAAEIVEPDYVDVSSGVESAPGVKDPEKMRAFFRALGR